MGWGRRGSANKPQEVYRSVLPDVRTGLWYYFTYKLFISLVSKPLRKTTSTR